jgi:hypothetical protein
MLRERVLGYFVARRLLERPAAVPKARHESMHPEVQEATSPPRKLAPREMAPPKRAYFPINYYLQPSPWASWSPDVFLPVARSKIFTESPRARVPIQARQQPFGNPRNIQVPRTGTYAANALI